MAQVACGIDIGGSGVKGALVDLETGEYIGDQVRIPTPDPATPDAVAAVCREVIDQLDVKIGVPIGVTFPAPVFDGVIPYMANLDQSWVNVNVDELMERYLGRAVVALNDADAAGIAEVAFGAAKGRDGVIVFTTQGTGIGSAIIVNGTLLTNTELGHLEIDGHDAEKMASSGQKTLQGLDWEQWAQRLQRYYGHVEFLLNPDLFVVGGGARGCERADLRSVRGIPARSRGGCWYRCLWCPDAGGADQRRTRDHHRGQRRPGPPQIGHPRTAVTGAACPSVTLGSSA